MLKQGYISKQLLEELKAHARTLRRTAADRFYATYGDHRIESYGGVKNMIDMSDQVGEGRFVSPCAPPEGYAREVLTILVEECSEVQKRATKALRFGLGETQPGQEWDNAQRLGAEVGDLLEMVDLALRADILTRADIDRGRASKRKQLGKFMQARSIKDA